MRPYAIAGILSVIILCVVAGMWLVSWINAMDFTTALAVGLVLIIPFIWWWAYNKERDAKQQIEKLKPKKDGYQHPTFSGIETNPEKMDPELRRKKEDDWKHFPANYK